MDNKNSTRYEALFAYGLLAIGTLTASLFIISRSL